MNSILKKFVDEPLFEACAAMLNYLHISFNEVTRTPVPFEGLYRNPLTKALQEILVKVENTYFIGTIDEASLSGRAARQDENNVTAKASEGKYVGMMIFAVDIKPNHTLTRTELATLTRGFNRIAAAQPVVLFIKQGNRLALATCERSEYTQQWRDGEKLGKVSLLRGINCLQPHRGHIDILESIGDKAYPTFEELYKHWMQVFSSELLTRKFYSELSDWYAWAVQVARFPNDLATTEDDEKFNHESCIRLITRLIFVWFLKQKHLIPEEFFDENYIREHFIENFDPHDRQSLYYNAEESKYYRLILQNLFFAMLNRPIVPEGKDTPNNRRFRVKGNYHGMNPDYAVNNLLRYEGDFKDGGAAEFLAMANSNVPFLNGGLFDCLDDKPKNLYYDGFSERRESLEQLYLPDWLFFGEEVGKGIDLSQWYDDAKKRNVSARGIIDILKRYNFTIEENTPLDQEVSLDPELLGKAFENLLASYNPETKTSARKQTGSFYTPREIVQYMVDESLVAHLKRICGDEMEPQYRSLLSYATNETTLNEEQRRSIMQAIYNCRVLDPACGSGAFPMGVLQQMVHILRQLDPTNEMWKDFMIDIAIDQSRKAFNAEEEEERKARLADIEEAFNRDINDPDYARKLYLIEHCIYGVDIQPIAVQISKLRFFISLVVDQNPTGDAAHNFGIRPLPNLESKFVAANTLIPVEYDASLFESTEAILSLKEQLKELNHKIFLAKRNIDKQRLKAEIKETRRSLAKAIEDTGFVNPGAAQKLADWDMFEQNTHADFFDAEWMFGVKGGFDIVIGNPPYIQLQSNNGILTKTYQKYSYETLTSTGDIYCLMYERGWMLLRESACLCFITSNKWMRAGYGEKTRKFLIERTNPQLLVDFAGTKVFDSATVETNILLFAREKNKHATKSAIISKQIVDGFRNLSDLIQKNYNICDFASSERWFILSQTEQNIKKKIDAAGKPLKQWDIRVNFGIKTGYNDAFIIDADTRKHILNNCQTKEEYTRTKDLIRPILRGRDIRKYNYDHCGLYIINTHNGVKGCYPRVDVEDYPAIKAHLNLFKNKIATRSDKGDTPYNLRNCAYIDDFSLPKIIWKRIGSILRFSYDESGSLGLDSTCFATGSHIPYLCCVFNSKMGHYLLKDAPKTGTGDLLISVQAIEPIRVPYFASYEKKLSELLFQILSKKEIESSADTSLIELQIDRIVYHLYGLTYDEVLIIDPTPPFTQEEYEQDNL